MTEDRKKQIEEAAEAIDSDGREAYDAFIKGAHWADSTNPRELEVLRSLEQVVIQNRIMKEALEHYCQPRNPDDKSWVVAQDALVKLKVKE